MKYTRRILAVAVSTVVIGMRAMSAWVAFPSEDLLELAPPLERMHYWGGNAKGFMSVQKLAKGNGLDEKYKATAIEIAAYLSSSQRRIPLLTSKLGDGNDKYACNMGRCPDVYEFSARVDLRRRAGNEVVDSGHGDVAGP